MKDLQSSRKISLWRTISFVMLITLLTLIAASYWYYNNHVSHMNNQLSDLTLERNQLQAKLKQQQKDLDQAAIQSDQKSNTEHTSKNGQLVTITSPLANSQVTSPVQVTGIVPENWFNQEVFEIVLENSSGTVIAKTTADMVASDQAKSANFKAQLSWDGQETGNGILRLNKANPSGLQANADQVEIALKF